MKKILSGVLVLAMLCSFDYALTAKADSNPTECIASLDYIYTDASDVTEGSTDLGTKYGSKTDGYAFSTGNSRLFASITGSAKKSMEWSVNDDDVISEEYTMGETKEVEPVMAATSKNPWTADTTPYFEVETSSKGYEGVTFSAYVGASKKGPRDYQISYAIGDSTEFTVVSGSAVSLASGKVMTNISSVLPEEASDADVLKIRVEIASMFTVKSTEETPVYLTDSPTGGEAAMNHIIISGIKKAGVAEPTPTAVSTAEPTMSASIATPLPTNTAVSTATPSPTNMPIPTAASTKNNQVNNTVSKDSVKKIILNKTTKTLKKNKTFQLKAFAKMSSGKKVILSAKKLKWKSSKKKIATVSNKGKVKAKKKGKAKITATYAVSGTKFKATCKISVV